MKDYREVVETLTGLKKEDFKMAQPAIDIQVLTRNLDTLDSPGPVARNLQQAYMLTQMILAAIDSVNGDGATASTYILAEDWLEANRAAYKTDVDAALAGAKTVLANLKALVHG